MKLFFKDKFNEQGSVLVVALLMLVLLTLIGVSATSTTDIETQIAGNYKFQKGAFFTADSGVSTTAKLISNIWDTESEPDIYGAIHYDQTGGHLLDQIKGYAAYDNGVTIDGTYTITQSDLTVSLGASNSANVDVQRTGKNYLSGSGVEFASGEVGTGAAGGGLEILFQITSTGNGPGNSHSTIIAGYRKVTQVVE